jgi:hypothetical protein
MENGQKHLRKIFGPKKWTFIVEPPVKKRSFFSCFYLYRTYFSSFLNMFFMLPTVCFSSLVVHVFYLSVACYIIARFLLIPCMLFTSVLHVLLVVCTHYFSRIYLSSLFFCSRNSSPPVFPYRSSRHDHCFLHGCPSFALPLNPSLKRIYAAALSTRFYIYSVRGLDRRT